MAMVIKTMEEIMAEMTPERMALEAKWLENHVDEYDPENPPLTKEELSRFRHHKDIPPEIEIMARVRAAEAGMKTEEKNSDDVNKSQDCNNENSNPVKAA